MTIVVAGHTGLAGSAIYQALESRGYEVFGVNTKVVDLLDRQATFELLKEIKPSVVIDAAARVGGIGDNNSHPVDFLSQNLQIQTNLIDASHMANVDRFVFLGSSCIYPRDCSQPIKEDFLLTGTLERTNSSYAVAKIAGIELIKSYRKQYGKRWISLLPCNLYGPRDNFDESSAHVLPALISKFVNASQKGEEVVELWGSGKPKREFLFSEDFADAVVICLEEYDDEIHLNVGSGSDLSIFELATLIARKANFKGKIEWDTDKPDGTPRKLLDISRITKLGWRPNTSLEHGIEKTIEWFKQSQDKMRIPKNGLRNTIEG